MEPPFLATGKNIYLYCDCVVFLFVLPNRRDPVVVGGTKLYLRSMNIYCYCLAVPVSAVKDLLKCNDIVFLILAGENRYYLLLCNIFCNMDCRMQLMLC